MNKKIFIRCGFNYSFSILAATVFALLTIPDISRSEIHTIDPTELPMITLPAADAARMQQLLNVAVPRRISELSPDGYVMLASLPDVGVAFFHSHTLEKIPVDHQFYQFRPVTEIRWIDNDTLSFIGESAPGVFDLIRLDRHQGHLASEQISLPGFPLSISNRGDRVLLVQVAEPLASAPRLRNSRQSATPPIKMMRRFTGFHHPRVPAYADEEPLRVPVATAVLDLVMYHLTTGQQQSLTTVPMDTALLNFAWSPRDRRLAIVHGKIWDTSRSGPLSVDSADVQDALGNLPPEDNPFFATNTLDLFRIRQTEVRHYRRIRPRVADGGIYAGIAWDPSGRVFVAKLLTPSTPAGRNYPTYGSGLGNGSFYQFHLWNGRRLAKLEHSQTRGVFGWARMISPVEALIHTPYHMDFALFSYNLLTEELSRLPTPTGTVHSLSLSPLLRETVFMFSSYQQPYELFRMNLWGGEPVQLTRYNDEIKELNRVRVDPVQFTLANGEERLGHLVRPADSGFPPNELPIVFWQDGGPISPMSQQWGGQVEIPTNLLPNFGIAVLVVPLPGRDGFGPAFIDRLVEETNFGQIDIAEQVEIIEQLVQWGYTAWDKVGVTGCSYGGYFSAQSITSYENAYAAANPQCALLDLFHEWEMGFAGPTVYLTGATPDNEFEYYRDSPRYHAAGVETPTLIFSGSQDFLPAAFSLDFHDQIEAQGTPADYYEFIGEYHGLYMPNSQFAAAQAQLEWFRSYLQ